MTRRSGVQAFLLALALAPAAATAEEVPLTKLYKDLAERNHYPAAAGLKDAQADAKCSIMEQLVAAFPDAADKPITVKFFWRRASEEAAPEQKFVISGIPEALTDLTTRANQTFGIAKDLVVPSPVYWTIAQTDAKADLANGTITITGTARSPSDAIKKIVVRVDGSTYQVAGMEMDLGQAQASVEMTSKDLGGKWGIEKTVVKSPQFTQTTTFEHAQVDGFWLPSKISVEYKGPDGGAQQPAFVYEFSNWQVNKGLPEGAF